MEAKYDCCSFRSTLVPLWEHGQWAVSGTELWRDQDSRQHYWLSHRGNANVERWLQLFTRLVMRKLSSCWRWRESRSRPLTQRTSAPCWGTFMTASSLWPGNQQTCTITAQKTTNLLWSRHGETARARRRDRTPPTCVGEAQTGRGGGAAAVARFTFEILGSDWLWIKCQTTTSRIWPVSTSAGLCGDVTSCVEKERHPGELVFDFTSATSPPLNVLLIVTNHVGI